MQKNVLKLYGEIWKWGDNSAQSFITRLNDLDSQGLDVINLHIHCHGGEVLEGIAIHNAIKACKTPVDAYIDGVAASMATIVMLACRKIYMADNAFLMIHSPSGYASGTSKDFIKTAKVLKAMEINFRAAYVSKTGKADAEVSLWLDGENWFSAKEALSEKLIDGIVGAVDAKASIPQKEEIKTSTATMLYQRFAALNTTSNNKSEPQKSKSSMNKEEIIKKFGLTSVTAESSEEAIYAAIEAKMKEKDNALNAEKTKQITALVDSALAAHKITAAEKDDFITIGTVAGVSALQTALGAIKPLPSITDMIEDSTGNDAATTARANWKWDDYQKNDPAALEALEKSNPTAFKALFNAKYKK
ncbi:MAG: ATP-dependent Clp protease proteolytic subunit [Prevotella sp.]|jgi:ATP-dependent protease ClpP protease subunit|nr:ATP-dependent Clp protease proteolytic subunit [Prevotella sp.]